MIKKDFYCLDNILKFKGQYYIIYGERSNGKSFACDRYVLDKYFKYGEQFVITKRYAQDINSTICANMLVDHYDYILETYGYHIRFYQSKWYATKDIDTPITKQEVIGYSMALNISERYKGSQYPKVTTIIFEEFMSLKGEYLPNEINLLMNLVSTIARKRNNVNVFMLGNAISKYSPYFEALNLNANKLKIDEIQVKKFKYGKTSTTFVIERSKHVVVDDNGDVYSNFGKVKSSMINDGGFETGVYNQWNDGVTFPELKKEYIEEFNCKPQILVRREHRKPIAIYYNEEYYAVYIIANNVCTVAVKKCIENKPPRETIAVINGYYPLKCVINIKNICSFRTNKELSTLLDIIVNSFDNNDFIYLDNETGEDVETAFKLCGLSRLRR